MLKLLEWGRATTTLLITAMLTSLLLACDVAPPLTTPTSTPANTLSEVPTMKSEPTLDLLTGRKLLLINTTEGEMMLEVYPNAAPSLVAAFSQHYQAARGRTFEIAGAYSWFLGDTYDAQPPVYRVPLETNDLAYKRGSLVLPFNRQKQVNVASFAILNHDVLAEDDSYAEFKAPTSDNYPGFVVVGQLVAGWSVLRQSAKRYVVEDIYLLEGDAAEARLTAVPPIPSMRTNFEPTHLFTMTIKNRDKNVVLSGELYGKDAPEGVALFLKEYPRYKGATVAARDTSISISDLNGSVFRPMLAGTTLPLRRGSLVWGGNDGTDVSTIYLNKYDDGTLGTGVIGQLTSDLDLLSKIGKERIGGNVYMGDDGSDYDKVAEIKVHELSPVPLATSITADPAQKGLNYMTIQTSKGYIDCPFYFAATQPTKGDRSPVLVQLPLKVEPGRVTLKSRGVHGLNVPIELRRNNLPYKRGSVLMRRSPTLHMTDNIIILTADLPSDEEDYVVVGEVTTGTDSTDKQEEGMSIVDSLVDGDKLLTLWFY